jgi:signal-induced proliferation-associated 1 like protein 3
LNEFLGKVYDVAFSDKKFKSIDRVKFSEKSTIGGIMMLREQSMSCSVGVKVTEYDKSKMFVEGSKNELNEGSFLFVTTVLPVAVVVVLLPELPVLVVVLLPELPVVVVVLLPELPVVVVVVLLPLLPVVVVVLLPLLPVVVVVLLPELPVVVLLPLLPVVVVVLLPELPVVVVVLLPELPVLVVVLLPLLPELPVVVVVLLPELPLLSVRGVVGGDELIYNLFYKINYTNIIVNSNSN